MPGHDYFQRKRQRTNDTTELFYIRERYYLIMDSTKALKQTEAIVPRETLSNTIAKKRSESRHIVKYTPQLCNKICSLIITGKSLTSILSFKSMPSMNTFYKWLDIYPEFKTEYHRARILSSHAMVSIAQDQPDKALDEVRKMSETDKRCNALVQAHKLRADKMLEIAGIINKSEYGNAPTVQVNNAIGIKLDMQDCATIRSAQ